MLRTRILTALVLIPLVVAAVWWLPSWGVAVLVGAILLVGAYEWSQFIPAGGAGRWVYIVLVALLLGVTGPHSAGQEMSMPLLSLSLFWWFCAGLWLARYPAGFGPRQPGPLIRAVIGMLILVPASASLWAMHALEEGRVLVLTTLALVWATDTGGYFVGKRVGRHKLAPQVSPNKTWEGVWGGLAFAALIAVLARLLFLPPTVPLFAFVLLALGVAAVSIVGDLTISMFKRQCQVKDTGTLIPGHGGVLDRLDSLFAAAPLLYLGYAWLA